MVNNPPLFACVTPNPLHMHMIITSSNSHSFPEKNELLWQYDIFTKVSCYFLSPSLLGQEDC